MEFAQQDILLVFEPFDSFFVLVVEECELFLYFWLFGFAGGESLDLLYLKLDCIIQTFQGLAAFPTSSGFFLDFSIIIDQTGVGFEHIAEHIFFLSFQSLQAGIDGEYACENGVQGGVFICFEE